MQITFTQAIGTMLPKVNTIIKLDDIYYITEQVINTELDYTLGESQVKILIECDRILRAYAFKDSGFIVFIADKNHYFLKEKNDFINTNFEGLEVCINTKQLDYLIIYNEGRYKVSVFKPEDVYYDYETKKWYLKELDIIPFSYVIFGNTSREEISIYKEPIKIDPVLVKAPRDYYIISNCSMVMLSQLPRIADFEKRF